MKLFYMLIIDQIPNMLNYKLQKLSCNMPKQA